MHVNESRQYDELIVKTEKILLSNGQIFDKERKDFIKDFRTLDLMAVPGSGKTTLLLSKLLILENFLPLENNTGVLTLSHTNTAVEEITRKLDIFCPLLFNYPNYVGTIQRFVNKFLAIPYYNIKYKKNITSIDEKSYNTIVDFHFKYKLNYKLRLWLNRKSDPIKFLRKIRFNNQDDLIVGIDGDIDSLGLKDKNSDSYQGLLSFKSYLLNNGVLHYDDAYYLANKYIREYPKVIELLQRRFRYIFIDEMQDMSLYQHDLLEKIFIEKDFGCTSFQRLGDNNQAIYNSGKNNAIWRKRENSHIIDGSNRLTRSNARLASRFSVDNSIIKGLNNRTIEYKPILVVYNQNNVECEVIKKFTEFIALKIYKNKFEEIEFNNKDLIYKVISWRKDHEDKKKLTLSSFCPASKYINNKNTPKKVLNIEFDYYEASKTIKDIITDKSKEFNIKMIDKDITTKELEKYLKESEINIYDKYKTCIYNSIQFLRKEKYQDFYSEINSFLNLLKSMLINSDIQEDFPYVSKENLEWENECNFENINCNKCAFGDIMPDITSVHSVKGETHDVTLFLESFYNKKYESDIIHEVLCGKTIFQIIEERKIAKKRIIEEIKNLQEKNIKRGIKIREEKVTKINRDIENIKDYGRLIYVALTRAKSIVGYGVSRDKYNEYLEGKLDQEEWDIFLID